MYPIITPVKPICQRVLLPGISALRTHRAYHHIRFAPVPSEALFHKILQTLLFPNGNHSSSSARSGLFCPSSRVCYSRL